MDRPSLLTQWQIRGPPRYDLYLCVPLQCTNWWSLSSNTHLSFLGSCFPQLDLFQLVGAPLVENCLAGFNSSVFAYGQVTSQLVLLVPAFSFILHKMMFPALLSTLETVLLRLGVERHTQCGAQPMCCRMKLYRVINKVWPPESYSDSLTV
jgi:hypothetical protein